MKLFSKSEKKSLIFHFHFCYLINFVVTKSLVILRCVDYVFLYLIFFQVFFPKY